MIKPKWAFLSSVEMFRAKKYWIEAPLWQIQFKHIFISSNNFLWILPAGGAPKPKAKAKAKVKAAPKPKPVEPEDEEEISSGACWMCKPIFFLVFLT